LGRPTHSLLWGFKLLQERSLRAELLLSRCKLLEHGVLAAGSHPPAAAEAAEAGAPRGTQKKGGKQSKTPKIGKFCKVSYL